MRIVATVEGELLIGGALPGRGAWLCRGDGGRIAAECLAGAERRRAFGRAFRRQLARGAVEALRQA